jgi:hypothetical protein
MFVQTYTLDGPETFIKLGIDHNYGQCFELVCWVSPKKDKNLSLFYGFEVADATPSSKISLLDAIKNVKHALSFGRHLKSYISYDSYIHISAKRCLEQMLQTYSFIKAREKAAIKIQKVWKPLYENPASPICQRRLLREFEEFHKDLRVYQSTV